LFGWAFAVVSLIGFLPIDDRLALLINIGSTIASAFLAFSANRLEIRDKLEIGWIAAQGQQPAIVERVKLSFLPSTLQFGALNGKERRRREGWATDALVALASAIVVFVFYFGFSNFKDGFVDEFRSALKNEASHGSSGAKHDIFGFYPGMSVANFVALAQKNPMGCENSKVEQKTNGIIYSCVGTPNEILGIQFDRAKEKILKIGYDYHQNADIDAAIQSIANKFGEGTYVQYRPVSVTGGLSGYFAAMESLAGPSAYKGSADLKDGYRIEVTANKLTKSEQQHDQLEIEILLLNNSISAEADPLPAKF
jgi:hypothetical protein